MKSIKKDYLVNPQTQIQTNNYITYNPINYTIREKKEEQRARNLEILHRDLMKKIYYDLYTRNIELYQDNNLTFENFLFYFSQVFDSLLDFDDPDYKLLLYRMDLVVKSKFDNDKNKMDHIKNKLELNKDLNYLAHEDGWTLIEKYKNALYDEGQAKLKKLNELKYKKYINDLNKQILEKKYYVDPVAKKKDEIYLFNEIEKKKQLDELKLLNQDKILAISKNIFNNKCIFIDFLNKLEKDNFYMNEENKDLICFKINFLYDINNGRFLNDFNLINIVQQIIYENDLDKIKKKLRNINYRKELIKQMDDWTKKNERLDIMSDEERKMNRDWLEAAKAYFHPKYYISY